MEAQGAGLREKEVMRGEIELRVISGSCNG